MRTLSVYFLLLNLTLLAFQAAAQGAKIDSLLTVIEGIPEDSSKVLIYLDIAHEYRQLGDNEALHWHEKAQSLAVRIGYSQGLYKSYHDLAYHHLLKGEFNDAIAQFGLAHMLSDSIGFEEGTYESLFQMGVTLRRTAAYDQAAEYLLAARDYYDHAGKKSEMGGVDLELGIIHDLTMDLPGAMRYYRRALSLYLNIGDKIGQSRSYHVIAANYYHQEKFEKTIEYLKKSIAILDELGHSRRVSSGMGNIASAYIRLGDFKTALTYYKESVALKEKFGDKPGMAMMYANIGNCYSELGSYTKAKGFISKALSLTREIESPYILENALHQLYKTEERQGNFRQAYDAYVEFMQVREELLQAKKLAKIEDVKAQYAFQAEKDSMAQVQLRKEILYESEKAEQEATINALFMAVGGMFVVCLFLGYSYVIRKKRNQNLEVTNEQIKALRDELTQQNNIKSKLFSIIAHDLRGPITVFLGYYQLLVEHLQDQYKGSADARLNTLSDHIKTSAERILELLDGLINWALKEEGVIKYNPESIDLEECMIQNKKSIEDQALMKNIKLDIDLSHDIQVWADKSSLMAILRNLASNAVKFTPRNGSVKFSAIREKKHALIYIEDTGIGIAQEKLVNLFEINEENSGIGTNGEQGTGLGLNIVRDFIKMNKGDIKVSSTVGLGTVFSLRIPVPEGY